ncbi:substrate-binding periplasmic protein [Haliovirga abyssi]|uniref:Solute-binding protein family 3/N-terminal domain-containing protein n=1 Tax=Haliovirga abyssi TaxID=2996794 RepID=A0AAU9E036_9FUSO|nr:transporter substrate-binding domain-containing protein [Haliovirga abyssi]BDU51230.1 hypothetical protein HLVA_17990 [Haliovirga abyssi]
MKRRYLVLLMALVLGVMSFGETIKLTNGEWAPFNGAKLKGYGFASDVVTKTFAKVGVDVEYKFFPWKRGYILAQRGNYDGTVSWGKVGDRENYFYFSDEPILSGETVFFYMKGNDFTWDKLEDLKEKRIGGTLGYSYTKSFKNIGKKLDLAHTDLQGFKKLFAGRVDIFILDLDVGLKLIRDNFTKEQQAKFRYNKKPMEKVSYYLLLSKKVSKSKELIKKYNKGFKMLKDSGEYDKMVKALRNGEYE